uniref:DUF4005 domain-containing protein n=1 Tax=Setaria digitata TaxID=48799 RepID=A0A915Q3F7_9BILA
MPLSCKESEDGNKIKLDKTQEITVKSGAVSLKSTQTEKASSARSNTTQKIVTKSTQDDSTLARGRGTSIYEKMTKEQMIRAGKKQFDKLSSDTQRKSVRLGRPAHSSILARRKFQRYLLKKSQQHSTASLSERSIDRGTRTLSSTETRSDRGNLQKMKNLTRNSK